MVSIVFALLFALSLLPGRKPLCLRFAERISDGILPDGAERYCRRLSAVWAFALAFNSACSITLARLLPGGLAVKAVASAVFSAAFIALVFFVEGIVRRRRFSIVFHTSGSTSKPKEIRKTFESLARETAFHRKTLAAVLAKRPKFLATIEPGHMYGTLWREMLPKAAGCEVDPEVIMSPETLLDRMNGAERVFLVTTPSFLDRFTAYAAVGQYEVPRNAVEIVTSGALLTKNVAERCERVFGIAPREIFGSTETGGVAWRRQSAEAKPREHDWDVFDPVKISLKDGRLTVASPFSFKRRYTMGDGAVIAPDARSFRLLGRMDRIVKINEQRVSLPALEAALAQLPGIREAALVKIDGEHGDALGLVVVPDGELPAPGEEKRQAALALRRRLIGIFPNGTLPRRYRFLPALPRNPQGKILASELAKALET